MSTAAQVTRLVQPFLASHPEFVSVGRAIVLTPVRHVIRGIFVDRASIKSYIVPNWFVSILFRPPVAGFTTLSQRLDRATGDLDRGDAQARLLGEMERALSEVLIDAETVESLFEAAGKSSVGMHPEIRCLVLAALGRFAEAGENLAHHIAFLQHQHDGSVAAWRKLTRVGSKNWQRQLQFRQRERQCIVELEQLCSLVTAGDRKAVALLLHEWEATAVKRQKVEHLWEPTPFPVELGEGM